MTKKEPIKDNRGRVPNYVVVKGNLRHQPTGLEVPCNGTSHKVIVQAKMELDHLVSKAGKGGQR